MDGNETLRRFDPRRPFSGSTLHLLQSIAQWCGLHRRTLEKTLLRLAPSLARDPVLPLLVEDAAAVTPRAIVEIFEALTHFDRRAALAGLSVPTLVIAGEEDPLIPIEWARELTDRMPCATLEGYRGVSHGVPLEAPAALAKSLARFVRFGRWWLAARRWFVLRNMTDIDYC
jgi:pimeloyl-ACP methyl ester carboxylesterase